MNGKEKIKKS